MVEHQIQDVIMLQCIEKYLHIDCLYTYAACYSGNSKVTLLRMCFPYISEVAFLLLSTLLTF